MMFIVPFNYRLKSLSKDFIVTEIPLEPEFYEAEISEFSYLWLEKEGLTTFDTLDEIRKFFNLSFEEINAEGLKDEDAITSQLISVKKIISQKDVLEFNKKFCLSNRKIKIKNLLGYGKEPITPRFLHGNAFRITVRNLDKETAETFCDFCSKNRFFTFINYYDSQRFGVSGGPYNTHLIGKAIIHKAWEDAFLKFKKSGNTRDEIEKVANEFKRTKSYKEAFKVINPRKLAFFVSSYNSLLWNKAVSRYLKEKGDTVSFNLKGICNLHLPNKTVFEYMNIFSIKAYGFNLETLLVSEEEKARNLLATTTVFPLRIEIDEVFKGKTKVVISFFLPTGSYATMLIRQIFFRLKEN